MKYADTISVSRNELGANLKRIVTDLLAERLQVEGNLVSIPRDVEPEVKVKHSIDEQGGSLSLKISWDNYVAEEEAPAEEEF